MVRGIQIVGALLLLTISAFLGWIAWYPPLAPFLTDDAAEVQVTALGWNEWRISYRAPSSTISWAGAVGGGLERDGWQSPEAGGYGGLARSYNRASSFGPVVLWEWVFLTVDPGRPDHAELLVRRWIFVTWVPRPGAVADEGASR